MWQALKSLLQQASIGRSRSSVINSLQWTLVIILFAFLVLVIVHAVSWALVLFAIIVVAVVILLISAFIYFALTNPDSLRSETYSIVKTAIERKYIGDNLTGLKEIIEIVEGADNKALPPGPSGNIEPKE